MRTAHELLGRGLHVVAAALWVGLVTVALLLLGINVWTLLACGPELAGC